MENPRTQTLGYPRIGRKREVKRALESYWKGQLDPESLLQTVREVETEGWETQLAAGIDRIAVGDATLYDHVLDWAFRLGLIPNRFKDFSGLDQYFVMARGAPGVAALE
ncbi:MAG: 5-methyltetrahydropteroyltriglutamate--homocysteine S-methyltransferase, partial [Anaerolineae bacterium]|nr:5-methyltetrahydropteroyltriglutamate--homocysteine S-methyltransferase [Anaerolineae bacterium]